MSKFDGKPQYRVQNDYCNPHCACAPRVNNKHIFFKYLPSTIMQVCMCTLCNNVYICYSQTTEECKSLWDWYSLFPTPSSNHWINRSACNGRCTAVGEPENAMKHRRALVSEEELLETKSAKRVRKLLKHVSRHCTGKNRTEHI